MDGNNGGSQAPHAVEVKIEYTVTMDTGTSHRFHAIHVIIKPDDPHAMLEKLKAHQSLQAAHESCQKMVANLIDIEANGNKDGNPFLIALEERSFG